MNSPVNKGVNLNISQKFKALLSLCVFYCVSDKVQSTGPNHCNVMYGA